LFRYYNNLYSLHFICLIFLHWASVLSLQVAITLLYFAEFSAVEFVFSSRCQLAVPVSRQRRWITNVCNPFWSFQFKTFQAIYIFNCTNKKNNCQQSFHYLDEMKVKFFLLCFVLSKKNLEVTKNKCVYTCLELPRSYNCFLFVLFYVEKESFASL